MNVRLREEFELYANLRPVRSMVTGGRYEDIDIVLVRENLEGLYVAFEHTFQSVMILMLSPYLQVLTRALRESVLQGLLSTMLFGMAARRSPWSTRPTF